MINRLGVFILLGAGVVRPPALSAQATVPQFSAPAALPGDAARKSSVIVVDPPLAFTRDDTTGFFHLAMPVFFIDPPLVVTKNAAGETHVGVAFTVSPPPMAGAGLIVELIPNTDQSRIRIDPAAVLYRANAPVAIGAPCSGDAQVQWDRAYVYVCVPPDPAAAPDPANVPGFTWAGAALTLVAPAAGVANVTPAK
jgi:hypothetical protein